jgi:fructose-bisphosphate aldolase class I
MVLSGYDCPEQAGIDEVAEATLRCLRHNVPAAVPGIVFLSGGQSEVQATTNLDALNRRAPQPWQLSFSFGRALQAPVLRAWAGVPENVAAAQAALLHRAAMNGAARRGEYRAEFEHPTPAHA